MTEIMNESPRVVTREQWLQERTQLLMKEKALTRAYDALARERRSLPWVKIDKPYLFHTTEGKMSLADLFDGRSQLIVQHFMLAPGWEEGCIGCSFKSDHIDGALLHLEQHDVSLVSVSRAPIAEIEAFRQRMGWRFRWVSSYGSDFNYDFQVAFSAEQITAGKVYYNYALRPFESDELAGNSVFIKDERGDVFHTYSTYGRGDELVDGAYMYLDMTPKGRNETGPHRNLQDWVRLHDRYDTSQHGASGCRCEH
ncbi:MAG TPA: thioredoxin family protein [Acidobacteriaceae bacterium]|nr:thioredoxin family protein [Acidobacteriaceae bacterium]